MRGNQEIVSLLIDNGVDPNITCFNDMSPLFLATYQDYPGLVKVLLEKGADPNHTDSNFDTALHMGIKLDRKEVVKVLVDDARTVEKLNLDEVSPWDIALKKMNFFMMDLLIKKGFTLEDPFFPYQIDNVFNEKAPWEFCFRFSPEEIAILDSSSV